MKPYYMYCVLFLNKFKPLRKPYVAKFSEAVLVFWCDILGNMFFFLQGDKCDLVVILSVRLPRILQLLHVCSSHIITLVNTVAQSIFTIWVVDSYCLKTNLQVCPKSWQPGMIIIKEKLMTTLSCCPKRIGEWWKYIHDRFFLFSLGSLFERQVCFISLFSVGSSSLTRFSLHWQEPQNSTPNDKVSSLYI